MARLPMMTLALETKQPLRHGRKLMTTLRAVAAIAYVAMAGCASVSVLECDLECGEYEECAVAGAEAACVCVAGYEGDPCTWTGGIRDPEFNDPEAWETTRGAVILPLQVGIADTGIASIGSSALCAAGAVAQVVDMPRYEDAQPFVARVRFRNSFSEPVVLYNRAYWELRPVVAYPIWNEDRFCLGEAAYGGPVKFQIGDDAPSSQCFIAPEGLLEVDRFEIALATSGECPAPGEALNGDAERNDGWTFDVFAPDPGNAPEAGFASGVGANESRAVRLSLPARSEVVGPPFGSATMRTLLSVPVPDDAMPSPALEFWWRATEEWRTDVGVGSYQGAGQTAAIPEFDFLIGDGEPHVTRYCIPPRFFGAVAELAFDLDRGPMGSSGELVVDDVRIVSDASCGNSADLLDPSFDATSNRWPGAYYWERGDYDPAATVSVELLEDADLARTGSGVLELRYSTERANLGVDQWVWVPPPQGDAWPRVTFYSNVAADPPGRPVLWNFGETTTTLDPSCLEGDPELVPNCITDPLQQALLAGTGWRLGGDCLPTDWTERWVRVRIKLIDFGRDEAPELYDPPRSVLIDDFEITFDPGCAP